MGRPLWFVAGAGVGEPAFVVDTDAGPIAVAPPRPPGPPVAVARPVGTDTDAVLAGPAGLAC